jgi:predicted transposase YbfD/YdcC
METCQPFQRGRALSTDAMGCQTALAQSSLDAGADYLLAVKDNQPTLHAEIGSYFATAPAAEVEKVETIDKDHGRFEVRNYSVSDQVDWYAAERSYPGAPRFPQLTTIAMVESRIERGDKIESERRSYISSRALSAVPSRQRHAVTGRSKNKLHWVLDVTLGEDLSRLRAGHGAKTWRWPATSPSIGPPRPQAASSRI